MKRILLGSLLALTVTLPLRAEERPASRPATVPFDIFKTKHISVMIKVNGKGPYRVIFDTGSPVVLLSTRVSDEAGLLDKKAPRPLFSPFGAGGEAKIKTLQVGDLTEKNLPAIVMDHPAVQEMSRHFGPIEGIVGFPFFARYRMTLDYQARQMTFVPSGYKPTDALQGVMAALMDDAPAKVVGAAGQWGLVVDKPAGDRADGVAVTRVMPGSAAARAGLRAGDRLLTLDGRWTDTVEDTYLAASYAKPGTPAQVSVRRDGKDVELTVTPTAGL